MTPLKPNIGVIGKGGAVGVKLGELLEKHTILNDCLSQIPGGLSKLDTESDEWRDAIELILKNNDIIVLAVHDDVAQDIIEVRKKVNSGTRIVDCSTAHRTNKEWVYGLPELKNRKEEIEESSLVANPGCHSTAVILSVKPLVDAGLIKIKSAIVQSTTGYSGSGKEMIAVYEKDNNKPAVQYSTGIPHKHVPEMKDQTKMGEFIFQPEVTNYFNGLKTNTFLDLTYEGKELSEEKIIKIFEEYYQGKQFIKIGKIPEKWKIGIDENNGTQNASIYIKKYTDTIQVVTVIDNMTKGAAGAVIQNLNIMLGLNEGEGL